MKSILSVLVCLAILENGVAQQLSPSTRAMDSIEHTMKLYRASGSTLLAVGIAGIAGGGAWLLTSLSNDPNFIWETDASVDYTPRYLGSLAIMAAGGVLLGVGVSKLVKAHRLGKMLRNPQVSISPVFVPTPALGHAAIPITQTSISLQVPLGR